MEAFGCTGTKVRSVGRLSRGSDFAARFAGAALRGAGATDRGEGFFVLLTGAALRTLPCLAGAVRAGLRVVVFLLVAFAGVFPPVALATARAPAFFVAETFAAALRGAVFLTAFFMEAFMMSCGLQLCRPRACRN